MVGEMIEKGPWELNPNTLPRLTVSCGLMHLSLISHGRNEAWHPPQAEGFNWHKDGSYFRHFVIVRTSIIISNFMERC